MGKILIPEVRLYNFIVGILDFCAKDLEGTVEQDTFLYTILSDNSIEGTDYYQVAKGIFGRNNLDNPRTIEARMFFDRSRAQLPTIHISLPGESPKDNGIGGDIGAYGYVSENPSAGELREIITRRYSASYNILFTSENPLEVSIMYHVFRAILSSMFFVIQMLGLENPSFGGMDLQINDGLTPNHIMVRALSLTFEYEVSTPEYFGTKIMTSFEASGLLTLPKELEEGADDTSYLEVEG